VTTFDPEIWARAPFHLWTALFFVLGCVIGSLLNVCIHRVPRGESIVRPPSHCPHCGCAIPWYLNIPLVTWVYLGGQCAHCKAPIAIRYLLVELLTGLMFAACWLGFGHRSILLPMIYCLFISGLIVATFIDLEHFIIPDGLTIGGMAAGFICSFLAPGLHRSFPEMSALKSSASAMRHSLFGMAFGAALVYGLLRLGKLLFGRHKVALAPRTRIIFGESSLKWADQEFLYEELFYRSSDEVKLEARCVELVDRCYANVAVALKPDRLQIGEETLDPEKLPVLEVVTDRIVLPREAMGLGDVKFMGAIGSFLGWPGVVFSLGVSSVIGAAAGLSLIALKKRDWSNRLPYGPYIALAAVIWIFGGWEWVFSLFNR